MVARDRIRHVSPVNRSPIASPVPSTAVPTAATPTNQPVFITEPFHREQTVESSIHDPEITRQRLQVNQELLNLLSKIRITNKLTDNNSSSWSQAVIILLE